MSTQIYYFSGTGNSLAVARNIADKTNGELISIPSVMNHAQIQTDADIIGIVFPVYFATKDSGIPLIVGRFVRKLENLGSKYIFAICTHGGGPARTIENLKQLVKSQGGTLSVGFAVKMSNKILPETKQQKIMKAWNQKLEFIADYVNAQKMGRYETRSLLGRIIFAPLLLLIKPVFLQRYRDLANESSHAFDELIPLTDRSYQVNQKCNGCGICVKVCPVANIKIVDNKPSWLHHCENCYGCYQWCPQEAIYGEIIKYNPRYHHPEVKLSDMI